MPTTDLFSRWRLADQAAMAATKFTVEKSMRALAGRGDPPSSAETAAARRLRLLADHHFLLAMARMDEVRPARQCRTPHPT